MIRPAAAAVAALLIPLPAEAQSCGPRDVIAAELERRYSETVVAAGDANIIGYPGAVAELLTSAGGSTWTIIAVLPDGIACIVGAGTDWTNRPRAPAGEPL